MPSQGHGQIFSLSFCWAGVWNAPLEIISKHSKEEKKKREREIKMQSQCLRRILLSYVFCTWVFLPSGKASVYNRGKMQCRTKCRNMKKVFNLNEVTEHVGQAVAYHLFCIQCGTTQGNCCFFLFRKEDFVSLSKRFDMKRVESRNTYSAE